MCDVRLRLIACGALGAMVLRAERDRQIPRLVPIHQIALTIILDDIHPKAARAVDAIT